MTATHALLVHVVRGLRLAASGQTPPDAVDADQAVDMVTDFMPRCPFSLIAIEKGM